jgi:hypothetical protein
MRKTNLVFNVCDWRKNWLKKRALLAVIKSEIDKFIDGTHSGCVVVTLNGPMNGEEVNLKGVWRFNE